MLCQIDANYLGMRRRAILRTSGALLLSVIATGCNEILQKSQPVKGYVRFKNVRQITYHVMIQTEFHPRTQLISRSVMPNDEFTETIKFPSDTDDVTVTITADGASSPSHEETVSFSPSVSAEGTPRLSILIEKNETSVSGGRGAPL